MHADIPYDFIACNARSSITSVAETGKVPINILARSAIIGNISRVERLLQPAAQKNVVVHPGTLVIYMGKIVGAAVDFTKRDASRQANASVTAAACRGASDKKTGRDRRCMH